MLREVKARRLSHVHAPGFRDTGTVTSANIVESHISRLRSKLSQYGGAELIHTVRGSGYALRAPPPDDP